MIPPFKVTGEMLDSNVPVDEIEWTAAQYDHGVRRYEGTTLYEVQATSTGDRPVDGVKKSPATWLEVGSINKFKMFDFTFGDATRLESADIDVKIDSGTKLINGIGLFGLVGDTVRVRVTDPVEGVVYDQTRALYDFTGITNWWQFFFAPVKAETAAVFTDLPAYIGAEIRVTVSASGGDTAVGELLVGTVKNLGTTRRNFGFGIDDFSRKDRDSFGRFSIVERRFARLNEYDVWMPNEQVRSTFKALTEVRATPVVYIGSEGILESVTLGLFRRFRMNRRGNKAAEMTIEVEGLDE